MLIYQCVDDVAIKDCTCPYFFFVCLLEGRRGDHWGFPSDFNETSMCQAPKTRKNMEQKTTEDTWNRNGKTIENGKRGRR